MNARRLQGFALGIAATVIWGSFYPVSRYLFGRDAELFDEHFASFLRFLLASFIFTPLLFTAKNRPLVKEALKKSWLSLLLLGLIGITGEGVLLFIANKYTTAARASLMANTTPIPTAILAYFFAGETLTRSQMAGLIIGLTGAFLAVVNQGEDVFTLGASTITGDLIAFVSGLFWAFFTVFGKEVTRRYGAANCMGIMYIVGVCSMIVIMLIAQSHVTFDLPLRVWAGLLYLGISGALANCLWYGALKYINSSELGSSSFIAALLAAGSSIIFLGEKVTPLFLLSAAAVVGGVFLVIRESSSK